MGNSDILKVSGAELENTSADTQDALTRFNNATSEFNTQATELNQSWSGPDYDSMMNNIHLKLDPLTNTENGKIPTLISDIRKELDDHNDRYSEIQNHNTKEWE